MGENLDEKKSHTKVVRDGVERACKELTLRLAPLGFVPGRKMFWIREREQVIEFVHLHRMGSSYGAPYNASVQFRERFGIRVLNDDFPAAGLNGPSSDRVPASAGRYHLRFNASSGDSFERCMDDLTRFVVEQGEPWFGKFSTTQALLDAPDSPLTAEAKAALAEALAGRADPARLAASRQLVGRAKGA